MHLFTTFLINVTGEVHQSVDLSSLQAKMEDRLGHEVEVCTDRLELIPHEPVLIRSLHATGGRSVNSSVPGESGSYTRLAWTILLKTRQDYQPGSNIAPVLSMDKASVHSIVEHVDLPSLGKGRDTKVAVENAYIIVQNTSGRRVVN